MAELPRGASIRNDMFDRGIPPGPSSEADIGSLLASLVPEANGFVYFPTATTIGQLVIVSAIRTLLAAADVAAFREAAGLEIGEDVQAYDAATAKTDAAQTYTAAQNGAVVTLTDAATIAINLSLGNNFKVTLGDNRTLGAPTGLVAGRSGIIEVIQDGTGSRTLSYNAAYSWGDAGAPTLQTGAGKVDLISYYVLADGATVRLAFNKGA